MLLLFYSFLLYNLIPYVIKEWACVRDGLWSFPFSFIISTLSTMVFPLQYIYVYSIFSITLIYRWLWNRSIILPAGLLYIHLPLLFYLFNSSSCLSIQLMKGYCQVVLLSFWLREAITFAPFSISLDCLVIIILFLLCLFDDFCVESKNPV